MKRVLRSAAAQALIAILGLATAGAVYAETVEHEVQRGDTLFSLSRTYGVPVDALRDANELEDADAIHAGTTLVIPDQYEVVRGDTLYSIARRHGLSVNRLVELNRLSEDDVLRVGDRLYVPRSGGAGTAEPAAQEPPPAVAIPDKEYANDRGAPYWPHPGERDRTDGKFPGVAIRGNRGDEIVSVASGRVVYAGPHSSFGRVVFVQSSSGHVYVYAGNEEIGVDVGDAVETGAQIGTLGSIPGESEAQLYFGVWKDNRFLDPDDAPRG